MSVVKDLSVSTCFGACVGVAVKKLSKDVMYGIGMGFMGLQTLSYLGYIDIKWHKVSEDITKAVDQDGDGKLTTEDAKIALNRFLKVMQHGLPNAAGFVAGFYGGIKMF